ncbi:MAG: universal stress protein [Microcystaceae cyanobacterium]
MFKTILFPVDRSRESQESAETVKDLVKTFDSRLVVLSVVEQTATGDVPSEKTVMSSPEAVAQLLDKAKSYFAQQGITVETIEREGMPSFTICDVADEMEADLIVMGCRGLGLTEEGAIESVTNRVINLAPCAVLIIP